MNDAVREWLLALMQIMRAIDQLPNIGRVFKWRTKDPCRKRRLSL